MGCVTAMVLNSFVHSLTQGFTQYVFINHLLCGSVAVNSGDFAVNKKAPLPGLCGDHIFLVGGHGGVGIYEQHCKRLSQLAIPDYAPSG